MKRARVGIFIDAWKWGIFERRLTTASFSGQLEAQGDMMLLTLEVDEYRISALKKVIEQATIEAANVANKDR